MAKGLTITGPRSAFDDMISSAGSFTANDSGSAAHLRYVLIEAKDGKLLVTSESNSGAIQFEPEGIKVESDGRMLVRHNFLSTALGALVPNQDPTLDHDEATNQLTLSAGVADVKIVTAPISSEATVLPTVGDHQKDNGITVAPEHFSEWYTSLAPFRGPGSTPIVAGVYVDTNPDVDKKNRIRGIAVDGRTALSFRPLNATIIGNGLDQVILEHEGVNTALGFFKKGSSVDMFINAETRRIHVIVNSSERELYHIALPLLNVDPSTFPAEHVIKRAAQFASRTLAQVKMTKSDMLQLMRNAAAIGSLNPTAVEGAAKIINIDLYEETFRVTVGHSTDASYDDRANAVVEPLDSEITAGFSVGLFGSLIEAYHNEDDPETIRFSISHNESGDPIAILMYFDEIAGEDGGVSDSMMIVPLQAPRKG